MELFEMINELIKSKANRKEVFQMVCKQCFPNQTSLLEDMPENI